MGYINIIIKTYILKEFIKIKYKKKMMKIKPLTVDEIFDAYNTHNDDFLILDIFGKTKDNKDKLRTNAASTVQYGDVLIKKSDGTIVPFSLKFIQITTIGRIKEPKDRDYETLKIPFRKNDEQNSESRFGEALDIICKTFEKKVNEFISTNKIATKPKPKSGSLKVLSTNPIFPIQYEVENRESGAIEELENPIIWIELKTQYYKPDDVEKLTQYENLYYKKDNKPVLRKKFTVNICDLSEKIDEEVVKYDAKTRREVKKIRTHIPLAKDNNDELLDNCNVNEFITPGSVLSGYIDMQLTISGRSFNLKTTFRNNSNLYVYPNRSYGQSNNLELDSDEVDEMIPTNLSNTKKSVINGDEGEDEYETEFDSQLKSLSDDE